MYIKPHLISDDEAGTIFNLARANNGVEALKLIKTKPELLWVNEKSTGLYPATLFAMNNNGYIITRLAEIDQSVLWQTNNENITVVVILARNNNYSVLLELATATPTILIQKTNPMAISHYFAEKGNDEVVVKIVEINSLAIDKDVIYLLAKRNRIHTILRCFELNKGLAKECGMIMPFFARRNNISAVMQLAKVCPDFLNITYKGRTTILWFARQNNAKAVLMLATEYPLLIDQTWQGKTATVMFALYGNIDSTIRLVDEFPEVLWQEYKGITISAMLHEPTMIKKLRI